jgi:hypothetical protein
MQNRRPVFKALSFALMEKRMLAGAAAIHYTSGAERREAAECGIGGNGVVLPDHETALDDIAQRLVRYLLFAQEASLPSGGVHADPVFLKAFTGRRLAGAAGKSLRDFDLEGRLFKYRCSYMIYTRGFASLPAEMKGRVFSRLRNALTVGGGMDEFRYLPDAEKRTIMAILTETGVLN